MAFLGNRSSEGTLLPFFAHHGVGGGPTGWILPSTTSARIFSSDRNEGQDQSCVSQENNCNGNPLQNIVSTQLDSSNRLELGLDPDTWWRMLVGSQNALERRYFQCSGKPSLGARFAEKVDFQPQRHHCEQRSDRSYDRRGPTFGSMQLGSFPPLPG